MKTISFFALLMLLVSSAMAAEITFSVEGELQKVEIGNKVVGQKIIAMGHEFFLSSSEKDEDRECLNGVYKLATNDSDDQDVKLLQILRCDQANNPANTRKNIFCPAVYMPVCGIAPNSNAPRTYGNNCELVRDGAKKLFDGACETALNSISIGAALNRFLK